jgi:hypothetical protein
MSLSTYRKLITQGLTDMGINLKHGPYSLKHAAIDKVFRLNLTLQQINKVARYAVNSTIALAHYNPTSSNNKERRKSRKMKKEKRY